MTPLSVFGAASSQEPLAQITRGQAPLEVPASRIVSGNGKEPDLQLLDFPRPLSQCLLWSLLENYYVQQKIRAWDQVPSYGTNNRVIGELYAEMVIALLLDLAPYLNVLEPVYIVEPAAGSACFAANFLEELTPRLQGYDSLKTLKLHYVLTDFTPANVDSWKAQPRLAPFIQAGLLDFAVFRPEEDEILQLLNSQKTLGQHTFVNPLIMMANYFFDSIRQDVFMVENQHLQEVQFTFFRELAAPLTQHSPLALSHLRNFETRVSIESGYYSETRFNDILENYRVQLNNSPFLLPIGALQCIRNLQKMANNRLVVLTTSKGVNQPESFSQYLNYMAHGDAFSFHVNFHAIQQFFQQQGGQSFSTDDPRLMTHLSVLMNGLPVALEHTQYTFNYRLKQKNPLLHHCQGLFITDPGLDLDTQLNACLAHLAQNQYEAVALLLMSEHLLTLLPYLSSAQKSLLIQTLDRVQQSLYYVDHQPNLWAPLGAFYVHSGSPALGLPLIKTAIQLYGENLPTTYYLALCYEAMGQTAEATTLYNRLLNSTPLCPLVHQGLARLDSKLSWQVDCQPQDLTYFYELIGKTVQVSLEEPMVAKPFAQKPQRFLT